MKPNKETTIHRMLELACANSQTSASQQKFSSYNMFVKRPTLRIYIVCEVSAYLHNLPCMRPVPIGR